MDYAVNAQLNRLLAGRYRMGHLLGSGGFGAVYFATDERLNRPVAIKVCSTRRLAAHEAAEAADLFQREALTLARLRHPGLTAIWDYFNQEDEWFLVMEYVPGDTLRERLRSAGGPLPLAEALDYANQTCQVLSYLHTQHPPIVFRDLKPGNIMITPDGHVKLIDFGIARLFSPGKTADTVQFGTPGYAPPEQYGGQTEPRSDIYGLGVVLHQMLTGHNPASSPFRLPPARVLNPAVSEALERLIVDATAYNIDHRIGSAGKFCSLLERARSMPVMTQPLPQTGMIGAHTTNDHRIDHQPRTLHTSQPRTLHTSQPWPHQPRALPKRPTENGVGRGMLVGLLLLLFLAAFGAGGYVLRERIAAAYRQTPSASPSAQAAASPTPPIPAASDPSLLVFIAETEGGGHNLYSAQVRRSRNGEKLVTDQVQQLTDFEADFAAALPAISPDGEWIAYTKVYTPDGATVETAEVWLLELENDSERRVLSNYAIARAPAWSPDGTKLAAEVATTGNETRRDIVIYDIEKGTAQLLLGTDDWEGGPTWSPDGTEIAYHARVGDVRCTQLFKINVETRKQQQLTDLAEYDCSAPDSGDYWPDWGPNDKIAFGRRNLVQPGSDEEPTNRVVVWDPSQPSNLQITIYKNEDRNTGRVYPSDYPRWAGNGEYLLFAEQRSTGDGLSYMSPSDPNQNKDVSIYEIDLPYNDIRYADWR
jgi:serine/threonine protein kinase/Tol biopolymer transport system component